MNKMKKKNAFTLIELLAVIVVLAIIALIATPIVMNTIKNAKKGAAERSADSYIRQVETYRLSYNLKNVSGEKITAITSTETKTLTYTANTGYQLPDSITVTGATHIWDKETGTLILSKATGDVVVTIVGEEKKAKTYANGEVVYFNVDNGRKCTSSEVVNTTGTKSGCMKFYTFNDDGKDTVNLILDHNTTPTVY